MNTVIVKKQSALGATLLISGCCIGAGMIGLPILSATAGFLPSSIAMLFAYFFATGTGLLLLEATLWFDKKVNLLSIAQFALGKSGKYLTCGLFLFLFYSLFVAYIDGGGQLVTGFLSSLFHQTVPREVGIILCVGVVGAITYAGAKAIDHINRGLLVGLAICYGALITLGLAHVQAANLMHVDWKASLATIPILLLCFGYQNLVPSLTYYLKRNVGALRYAIMIGNMIPFLIYFVWNFVILGMIPSGNIVHAGQVAGLLQGVSQSLSVQFFIQTFSVFALLTSFIPNALTFVDFLRDGLPIKLQKKPILFGLVLVPPMVFSLFYPNVFLKALGFAGGFVDLILFGALPVAVVWIGRYIKKIEGPYTVPGGKIVLALIFFLSLGFLLFKNFGGV